MKTSIKKTSKAWSKIAEKWEKYFTPPSRPSGEEIAKYDEWVGKLSKKGQKGLVLGATPELRDILLKNDLETHIIDINQEMIMAMSELMKQDHSLETKHISNWLDMSLQSDYYDFVLGDAVVPNVPFESREQFLLEIKRVLKRGGLFLNRAFCVPGKKRFESIDEVLKHFRDKNPDEKAALELVFEIQILTYDKNDHLGSMKKVREEVKKFRGDGGFNRKDKNEEKLLEVLWEYWLKDISDKDWVYDTVLNEKKLYEKHFQVNSVYEATDHPYGELTPLLMLEKNGQCY